jgi:hypothetical protein
MISQSGFSRRTWEAALIPAALPPMTTNLSLGIKPPMVPKANQSMLPALIASVYMPQQNLHQAPLHRMVTNPKKNSLDIIFEIAII